MSSGKKNDGRWYCAWWDPARARRVFEYFGRGAEAEKAARLRDLEIKRIRIEQPRKPLYGCAVSFRTLAQEYINARQVEISSKTIAGIIQTAELYALPVIGDLPANRVSMADWTKIEKTMIDRKVNARTINKYFQYLSKIFDWGIDREYIKEHPWTRRKPLRMKDKLRIELITPDEIQRILDAADDHLRWAIEVEYNTGVRPGPTELFALTWDDFDYETGALTVFSSKTGTSYTQYVSMEFLDRLKERRAKVRAEDLRLAKRRGEIRPECPHVISFRGEPVRQLANAWVSAKKRAGIARRIRLYDLRHFYITYALASGADLLDLAHRVGHKDANMIVNVYAHLVDEMRRKEAFNLPKIDFKANVVPGFVAKNCCQKEISRKGEAANNVITLNIIGRGGVI